MVKQVFTFSDVSGEHSTYVKKPIKIRAIELEEDIEVSTLEGILKGKKGDFLIEGVNKEVYVCNRDIFFKTYDNVTPKKDLEPN